MTSLKQAVVVVAALVASVPASADVFRWGGIYAGPAYGPTGWAGPTWTGYPGQTYISQRGKSDRKKDEFVFGAFAQRNKAVHSLFLPQALPLPELRLPQPESGMKPTPNQNK